MRRTCLSIVLVGSRRIYELSIGTKMALILRYSTEFGSFRGALRKSG